MSEFANPAASNEADTRAYVHSLLQLLGDRDPLETLRATPNAVRQLVESVSPERLSTPEAPGKWSMLHVTQHLADSELVGSFRFRMVLAHDRPAIAGYDQDLWADRLRYADANLQDALASFTTLRHANLALLERASPTERERVGIHAERGEESLGHMMKLYAAHDLVHLRQLARIRAAVKD
ncbi:MAG: DinB family protein [Gemmatimonadota bacterium]|nr:DinB family protein [Gemmatimonadota bacterium]